jgi:DnaK suppressor protein
MSNPAEVLRQKQRELLEEITHLTDEARENGEAEVRDTTDDATAQQGSAEALEEITLESQTLEQVEDALKRVADGTYGKCVICGRPISPARLEAIPWTPYCLDHANQQK